MDNRDFVNAASFEEAAIKMSSLKTGEFEDVVFGILNDSGLQQTVVLKSLLKKLIDSGFMDTEQVIFVGAIIASCIDPEVIKEWFSDKNIEFLADIDNYAFMLDTKAKVKTDKKEEE
jgi:hypothetical protein